MDKFIPFSERYGYVNPEGILKKNYENMTDELRVRLWNFILRFLETLEETKYELFKDISLKIWDSFFHEPINKLLIKQSSISYSYSIISYWDEYFDEKFSKLKWHKVYDLVEFIFNLLRQKQIFKEFTITYQQGINKILEEEHAPYRMVEGCITPITSEQEIQAIKETFKKADKYQPVREHLEKALIHLSNRTNPDYVNSIKESISALESLANLILDTSGKSLTKIHEKLCSQLKCPEPIKKQMKEYYDWASKEEGIRHGKIKEKSTIGQAEAKLFLIQISGLINYLISKTSQGTKND